MKKNSKGPQVATAAEYEALGNKLGFTEETLPVLIQALTHPAYFEGTRHPDEGDNQRLEFLGDAVLDLVIGSYLYRQYPDAQEGVLSKMRAYIVCEASLAAAARELGVDKVLRLGKGSEAGGDRQRPSILADAYEAVVGAVFLTQGYAAVEQQLLARFHQKMCALTAEEYEDKKSLLQELVQSKVPHGVSYRMLRMTGPDHQPHFESGVYCGKLLLGTGEGRSKKEGETAAAAAALAAREEWLSQIV